MRNSPFPKLLPNFLKRWSPRAFSSEQITDEEINTLFEAARWSPSCYNEQPWRFVYATSTEARERLLSVLSASNREWANRAPLIIIAFSHMIFNSTQAPNRWAAFD
ncbi:MAG: nitroreductase family protein, partial [Gammaproteobacteria bacterium]